MLQLQQLDPRTRQRIEQAVLDTFSVREFHKVKLIEIAQRANVSLQTIYKYYGDKETLLFSALETWLSKLAERLVDHLAGMEDFKEKLRKVFWIVFDFFEKTPEVAQLIMSSIYLNTWRNTDTFRQPQLMGLFMRVIGEGRARGILTDEVDEKMILDLIIGTASRNVTMWIIRGKQGSLTERANSMFELLWRAVSKPVDGAASRAKRRQAA